jgi:hypothetical protein
MTTLLLDVPASMYGRMAPEEECAGMIGREERNVKEKNDRKRRM